MATSYLQIENLSKSYGDRTLFGDITFGVNEGDKIGLIAKNGTGKSTLLNIISGKESPDNGKITFRNDLRVSILDQIHTFADNTTVIEACLKDNNAIATTISKYEKALASGNSDAITAAMQQMEFLK